MTVISASRRTDIPAFYSRWFMDKIERGLCHAVNPYNGRTQEVPLGPDAVDAIVFWTRDARPIENHLPGLRSRGYSFYFQYTITGYPRLFDPGTPSVETAAAAVRRIAETFGPASVVWRYDPIISTSVTDEKWHVENFRRIAGQLAGAVDQCVISFVDRYRKLDRNFFPKLEQAGVDFHDPERQALTGLALRLEELARDAGMDLAACCEPEIVEGGLGRAACIDPVRLARVTGKDFTKLAKRPTRAGCGCHESKDIGAYDTCPSGCAYCYANRSPQAAARNARGARTESLALRPGKPISGS